MKTDMGLVNDSQDRGNNQEAGDDGKDNYKANNMY